MLHLIYTGVFWNKWWKRIFGRIFSEPNRQIAEYSYSEPNASIRCIPISERMYRHYNWKLNEVPAKSNNSWYLFVSLQNGLKRQYQRLRSFDLSTKVDFFIVMWPWEPLDSLWAKQQSCTWYPERISQNPTHKVWPISLPNILQNTFLLSPFSFLCMSLCVCRRVGKPKARVKILSRLLGNVSRVNNHNFWTLKNWATKFILN